MSETERKFNESREKTYPRRIWEGVKSQISPKSVSKQRLAASTMEKEIQEPDQKTMDLTPQSTALIRPSGPRGPRAITGSNQPVSPASPQVLTSSLYSEQPIEPGQQFQNQPPVNFPDQSLQPTVNGVYDNSAYVTKSSAVHTVKELPLIPTSDQAEAVTYLNDEIDVIKEDSFGLIIQDQGKLIDELRADKEASSQRMDSERERYLNQIQELNQEVTKWKSRAIDAASKSADVHAQIPLSRPESELIKDWQNLAFDVRNFVANHFGSVSNSRLGHWVRARGDWLQDIGAEAAPGKRAAQALIEASIWNALVMLVFGHDKVNGPMCWAGRYHRSLKTLVRDLQRDQTQKDTEQFTSLIYQWGTLTANIVATIQSAGHRDEQVHNVVQDIEELLLPCRSRLSSSEPYRRDLRALVNKAIDMDFKLCGQTSYYLVGWPNGGRYDVPFEKTIMKLAQGSPQSSRTVRFMMQPCLFRAGGHGGSSEEFVVIDQCSVWVS
ncbi:amino acid transporter AAT family [Fusarium beomiforme]|uniref:Amino acid transporter AAT family n=1 Tax=Fusarium beomiforme TaxID=44412 RepID=A0A9P5AS39_9HYPO|nr:amino acid transporter AAT family [Fusarium beomiforme]